MDERVLDFSGLTEQHWNQLVTDNQAIRWHLKMWLATMWMHGFFRG